MVGDNKQNLQENENTSMNTNKNQLIQNTTFKKIKTSMNEHRNYLCWNSYDSRFQVFMKEKKSIRAGINQKSVKRPALMYIETSSGEIIMFVTSWFLKKKKSVRVEIFQKSVTEIPISPF